MSPPRRASRGGMALSESRPFTPAGSPPSNCRYDGIALNAATSVKADSRKFSSLMCSAALPAAGKVAATTRQAAQVIFIAELEIFAHTVVPLFDGPQAPVVVVRTDLSHPLRANL